MEQNYLDQDLDSNLNGNLDLDRDPQDASVYTGHSLFNITNLLGWLSG